MESEGRGKGEIGETREIVKREKLEEIGRVRGRKNRWRKRKGKQEEVERLGRGEEKIGRGNTENRKEREKLERARIGKRGEIEHRGRREEGEKTRENGNRYKIQCEGGD